MDCLFCEMLENKIPVKKIWEDDKVIAIHDIQPQAPTHILIFPKRHIATINEMQETDAQLLGHMILIGKKLAKQEQLSDFGYRLLFNVNAGGGQAIFHIHLHLLGGRQMTWPPG